MVVASADAIDLDETVRMAAMATGYGEDGGRKEVKMDRVATDSTNEWSR